MTATSPTPANIDVSHRPVPRLGDFNATTLRLEVRRVLRNRRSVFFTVFFPPILLLAFTNGGGNASVGHGNLYAMIMVIMGVYGAAMAAASSGAAVAMERAQGWSRQLRLTPLHPAAYITMKALVAVVMAALSLAAVNITAAVLGKAQMPAGVWISTAVLTVACSTVFAALGLFVGYLVPGENAMQVLGPGLAVLAFLGDLFVPLSKGSLMYQVAQWTPMFGVGQVSRAPLTGELDWTAVVNIVAWFAIFVAGAAWRMSRDTGRS